MFKDLAYPLDPANVNAQRKCVITGFTFFPARYGFYCLLITNANKLDPDQARQNAVPDLIPNCLIL